MSWRRRRELGLRLRPASASTARPPLPPPGHRLRHRPNATGTLPVCGCFRRCRAISGAARYGDYGAFCGVCGGLEGGAGGGICSAALLLWRRLDWSAPRGRRRGVPGFDYQLSVGRTMIDTRCKLRGPTRRLAVRAPLVCSKNPIAVQPAAGGAIINECILSRRAGPAGLGWVGPGWDGMGLHSGAVSAVGWPRVNWPPQAASQTARRATAPGDRTIWREDESRERGRETERTEQYRL